MERKEIVANLIKNGATMVKDITVKNVTVTPMEQYVRLGLTLDTEVDGFIAKKDGTYEKGKVKVIFVSAFSVASILKDDDDAAFAANHLLQHPESMCVILSRAKINIVQQTVAENEEYVNPWSENSEPTTFDHEVIINHLADVKLSDFAIRRLDKLADAMMGSPMQ